MRTSRLGVTDPRSLVDADPAGVALWCSIVAVILVGCLLKLFAGSQWDDWLDERWGRGSVRDWWLLGRVEREARDRRDGLGDRGRGDGRNRGPAR